MKYYKFISIFLLSLYIFSCVNINIKDNNVTSKISTDIKSDIKVDTKIQDSLKVDSEVNLSKDVISSSKQTSLPSSIKPTVSPNPSVPPVNTSHPSPPDPQQPKTEDDFWKLMNEFGFMQIRTKDALLDDIKKGLATKITDWSNGELGDKVQNITKKYTDNKKYFNPAITSQAQYLEKSLVLANDNPKNVDFYLDVEYGAKDGKGVIIMQRINPITLEVLYFDSNGFITNYTQTSKPKNGAPPALLRLTHFIFIPPSVYN